MTSPTPKGFLEPITLYKIEYLIFASSKMNNSYFCKIKYNITAYFKDFTMNSMRNLIKLKEFFCNLVGRFFLPECLFLEYDRKKSSSLLVILASLSLSS